MSVRLAVAGASGRMGRAVVRLAAEDPRFAVVAAVARDAVGADAGELAGAKLRGVAIGAVLDVACDVVIDFSAADATPALARAAATRGAAFVCGTTGLDDAGAHALDDAAGRVPVLWEPNMSVGVHVASELVARAIALLGRAFDVEIVEAHHRGKQDAPSGTAVRLAEVARAARGDEARFVDGRAGVRAGARPDAEIGIHAVRGGDVIGDHTVFLLGQGERLEITHRASNRDLFAHGALRAAAWLVGRSPGRYRLADVLAGEPL